MKLCYTFLLSLFFLNASAHDAIITGKISDKKTNAPLAGAIVKLDPGSYITFTDGTGVFRFTDVHDGIYSVIVSFIGYEKHTSTIKIEDGKEYLVDVKIIQASINLSEITVNASQNLSQDISLINRIDLDLRPIKTSQDILRIVPGIVTAQHAGGGKAEQIYLRGFDIDHGTDIRLTVDGIPVNMVSHAHGQGYADLHFITPEIIDHVDFNKGPYYAAQGNFTTAGFASFQTKNSLDKSSLKLEAGSFDSYRGVGLFNLASEKMKDKNQNIYVSGEYVYSNGPFISPQKFNRTNLFAKYYGLIDKNDLLSISVSTFFSKWLASGQIPDRAVKQGLINRFGSIDDKEGGNTARSNANIKWIHSYKNNSSLLNQFYFSDYKFELYSNFTFFLNDSINGDQIKQKEQRQIYGYTTAWSKAGKLGIKKLQSTIGAQVRFDDGHDIELSHTKDRIQVLDRLALGQLQELNVGVYIDENLQLNEKFTINASARFDQFVYHYTDELETAPNKKSASINIISPKLNIYYTYNENVQIYLKTGSGFHSNDARVVIPRTAEKILPRAIGADIGIIFKPLKNLLLNIALWDLEMEQEFVYVGDGAEVEPSGQTRRLGIDLSMRYQVLPWLYADADFNYTYGRSVNEPEGENYIPLAPIYTSIAGITTKFKNGLSFSIRERYVGNRPANEMNSVTAQGYFLIDGGINLTKKRYALGLTYENLLNVNWNEAQFDTESRLQHEAMPVSELHYTPGNPFNIKAGVTVFF